MRLESLIRDKLAFLSNNIPTNILLVLVFSILVIFLGALTSIVLFTYQNSLKILEVNNDIVEENNRLNYIQINQTREIPLQNLKLLQNINETQNGLIGLNDNLLTVYSRILGLTNVIDNNTDSNRNMTIQNRQMISFLRDNFDEQFLTEYQINNAYQQQTLDNILRSLNNISSVVKNMSK
jgi:amino acid transporter